MRGTGSPQAVQALAALDCLEACLCSTNAPAKQLPVLARVFELALGAAPGEDVLDAGSETDDEAASHMSCESIASLAASLTAVQLEPHAGAAQDVVRASSLDPVWMLPAHSQNDNVQLLHYLSSKLLM